MMMMKNNDTWYVFLFCKEDGLWYVFYVAYCFAAFKLSAQSHHLFLAHTIYYHVCHGITENALPETVFPVVVVRQPSHGSLYATKDNWNVRIKPFQYMCIDNSGIFRSAVMSSVRTISVL